MKAKIMAVLLAVGLGVAGVAVTAQAAEAGMRVANGCAHTGKIDTNTYMVEAINWDGDRHYVVYETQYFCHECGETLETKRNATYEPHDYEQTYLGNGQVRSDCTVCGDSYVW